MEKLKQTSKAWYYSNRKFLLRLKNDFYEIPYIANSPQTVINSLASMPFVEHIFERKKIISNNDFTHSTLHYMELEKGLFVFYANTKFKKNVLYKPIFHKHLPLEHCRLNFHFYQAAEHWNCPRIEGLSFVHNGWSFFKPGISKGDSHKKGANSCLMSIYLHQSWLENHLRQLDETIVAEFNNLLSSNLEYLLWPIDQIQDNPLFEKLKKEILLKRFDETHKEILLKLTVGFIGQFIELLHERKLNKRHFEIQNIDRVKIMKVEKILRENLYKKFPSVSCLASAVGLCETKLKSMFKFIYGDSLFNYFRSKQMDEAAKIILKGENKIYEIAEMFDYGNAGKFSAAYKNHFGTTPSFKI